FLRVEKTAGIADDQATIEIIARHGVPAAVGQRFRTVAHEFSTVEDICNERIRFPFLKRRVGIETRVGVFEGDNESDGDTSIGEPVNPSGAVHAGRDGPAGCVGDVSGLNFSGLDVPELFDADAVTLWINVVEFFLRDELFGK